MNKHQHSIRSGIMQTALPKNNPTGRLLVRGYTNSLSWRLSGRFMGVIGLAIESLKDKLHNIEGIDASFRIMLFPGKTKAVSIFNNQAVLLDRTFSLSEFQVVVEIHFFKDTDTEMRDKINKEKSKSIPSNFVSGFISLMK